MYWGFRMPQEPCPVTSSSHLPPKALMLRMARWISIAEIAVALYLTHIYDSVCEHPLLNNLSHPASGAAMHADSQGTDPRSTTISSWPQLLQQMKGIRPPD